MSYKGKEAIYKRKRSADAGALMVYRPYKTPYKRTSKRFVPGRDRVGGFYGRYAGPKAEHKFHDVDLNDAVVATAGTVTATVNIIAQGVTESTRNGRKCTISAINWNYRLSLPEVDAAADPGSGDTVRIIMYIDKQCNGAAATVTDVLESADWQSYRNLSNVTRFQVLHDKTYDMNYQALASDNAGVVSSPTVELSAKFYKKCSLPIEFNGATGAIGEIRSNNIGVLLISAAGVAALGSKIRLRFTDY